MMMLMLMIDDDDDDDWWWWWLMMMLIADWWWCWCWLVVSHFHMLTVTGYVAWRLFNMVPRPSCWVCVELTSRGFMSVWAFVFNSGHWLRLCPTRWHWKHTMLLVFPRSPLDFLHSMVQWFLKPQMLRAIHWAWNPETGLRAMPRLQLLQQAYRLGWRHTVIFRSPHSSMCLFGLKSV